MDSFLIHQRSKLINLTKLALTRKELFFFFILSSSKITKNPSQHFHVLFPWDYFIKWENYYFISFDNYLTHLNVKRNFMFREKEFFKVKYFFLQNLFRQKGTCFVDRNILSILPINPIMQLTLPPSKRSLERFSFVFIILAYYSPRHSSFSFLPSNLSTIFTLFFAEWPRKYFFPITKK